MEKILVTGTGGNVGQYVANGLSYAGYEVVGIYRKAMPENVGYELLRADLSENLLKLHKVDTVIHIAAGLSGNAKKLVKDNIKATENLIYSAEQAHVKRFVYMSTVSVYGNVEGELCEKSDVINPGCYGMTKYISECLVKESSISKKIILQLPRMIGPFVDLENTHGSGFLAMIKKIIKGENITCYIPEVRYNNYLHIAELERFLEQLLAKEEWPDIQTLLLGARERLTMLDILQIMKDEVNSRSEIILGDSKTVPKCSLIDMNKAKAVGFYPSNAESMLRRFIGEIHSRYK